LRIVVQFDYQTLLYLPLRSLALPNIAFIFPHETSALPEHSQQIILAADAVLAEVSYPSTGMGIELGWADAAINRLSAFTSEILAFHLVCN
jgi:hypothetical protein